MKLTPSKNVQITDLFCAIFPREAASFDVDCRKINRLAAFVELSQDAKLPIATRMFYKCSTDGHNTAAITPSSNSFLAGIFASEPITKLET